MFTVTLDVDGALPEAGFTLSHAASSVAPQLSAPPPVLVIDSVWLDGFDPPSVALKLKLVGLTPMVGGAGAPAVPL